MLPFFARLYFFETIGEFSKVKLLFHGNLVQTQPERALYLKQLQKVENKGKRIKAAYLNEIDTLEEYKANKAALLEERATIEKNIKLLTVSKAEMSKEEMDKKMKQNISALLAVLQDDSADYVQKGNMMRNVVDHIVFDRGNTSLDMFLKLVI